MSGRFDFHSGGAAATGALEQFLAEQENRKRQQMLDRITQQNAQSQQEDRVMNRSIQQQQLDSATEQKAQDANDRRVALRFKTAATVPAGAPMTPDLETELGPLAGAMTHSEGGVVPASQGEGPTETKTFTGDQHGQELQLAADAKVTAAQAAAEQKRQDAEDKAAAAATAAQNNADLRRELANGSHETALTIAKLGIGAKQDALATKAAEGQQKTDLARKAQVDGANDTLNALAALHDPTDPSKLSPQMGSIVGAWGGKLPSGLTIPGSEIANAKSRLAEVRSRLDVGLLNELKNQSRTGATGFGQLSANELKIIEAASGRLDTAQSPEQFMSALNDIETRVKRILAEPGASHTGDKVSMPVLGETAAPAAGAIQHWERGPDGRPRRVQ